MATYRLITPTFEGHVYQAGDEDGFDTYSTYARSQSTIPIEALDWAVADTENTGYTTATVPYILNFVGEKIYIRPTDIVVLNEPKEIFDGTKYEVA